MELKDTVGMMLSADYKERFKAEYYQLKTRYEKLLVFYAKYSAGALSFEPSCPIETYKLQLRYMEDYLAILEIRASIEGVKLE